MESGWRAAYTMMLMLIFRLPANKQCGRCGRGLNDRFCASLTTGKQTPLPSTAWGCDQSRLMMAIGHQWWSMISITRSNTEQVMLDAGLVSESCSLATAKFL